MAIEWVISLWVIIGIGLLVAEVLTFGMVMASFGAASLLVAGLLATGLIASLEAQLLSFVTLSLVLIFALRRYFPRVMRGLRSGDSATEDDSGLMGRRGIVEREFVDGFGTVIVHGTKWDARTKATVALVPGAAVVITGKEGITLTVAPASSADADGLPHV